MLTEEEKKLAREGNEKWMHDWKKGEESERRMTAYDAKLTAEQRRDIADFQISMNCSRMLSIAEPGEELERLMAMPPKELSAEYECRMAIVHGLAEQEG